MARLPDSLHRFDRAQTSFGYADARWNRLLDRLAIDARVSRLAR